MKLTLPNGMDYAIGANGERICRGAKMGRLDILPSDPAAPVKLQMERLKWVDGDYDQGGAYWGCPGRGMYVYCAYAYIFPPKVDLDFNCLVFVWSISRAEAKTKVRLVLPNATFYR